MPMLLYFMRHADAGDSSVWRGDDAARPLTEKGIVQAREAAKGLAHLRPPIQAVITSPYARAYETAVIVAKELGLTVQSADELTPGFDLSRLDRALALRPSLDILLFVGHEPDLSHLIVQLARVHGEEAPDVTMKKGSCCLVLTPSTLPGGSSAAELAGVCEISWIRTWRELADLREDSDTLA